MHTPPFALLPSLTQQIMRDMRIIAHDMAFKLQITIELKYTAQLTPMLTYTSQNKLGPSRKAW